MNALRSIRLLVLVGLALVATACASRADAPPAQESDAGTWSTWILSSPEQIEVPPPPAPGSARRERELAEVRRLVSGRTDVDETLAREWNVDPAVRPWLETAMEYVSLRPKDPPGASRAYGLVSVAMYDAVVATWHYKHRYDREPPEVENALFDPGPEPSYPSEHAAIAGAASRVLAYLFPEQPAARLRKMAHDAADSRVLAGVNSRSDVDAGLELGNAVGDAVIAHARKDGASRVWRGRRPRGRGYWAPPPGSVARPVQPLAGTWHTWVMESGDQFRSPPPPKFGSPEFMQEARTVMRVREQLTPEQKQIADFWAGGEGTPLPPGIWNQVALDYVDKANLSVPHQARVFALINVAMADAGVASWDTKYAYWYPRPENGIRDAGLDRKWKPYLDTPFFPAYVSGHATYSGAVGEVMAHLFPEDARLFRQKAREAAWSRVLGGIHWPVDGSEGLKIGRKIGALVVEWAKRDGADA